MLKINFDNGYSTNLLEFKYCKKKKSPLDKFKKLKLELGERLHLYDQAVYDEISYINKNFDVVNEHFSSYLDIPADQIEIHCSNSLRKQEPYNVFVKTEMEFTKTMNTLSYKLYKHCKSKICSLYYVTREEPCMMVTSDNKNRVYSLDIFHNLYLFALIRMPLTGERLEKSIQIWEQYEKKTGRNYYGVDDYIKYGYWDWSKWKYGHGKTENV